MSPLDFLNIPVQYWVRLKPVRLSIYRYDADLYVIKQGTVMNKYVDTVPVCVWVWLLCTAPFVGSEDE